LTDQYRSSPKSPGQPVTVVNEGGSRPSTNPLDRTVSVNTMWGFRGGGLRDRPPAETHRKGPRGGGVALPRNGRNLYRLGSLC